MTTQQRYVYDDDGNIIGFEPINDAVYQYNRDIYSGHMPLFRSNLKSLIFN